MIYSIKLGMQIVIHFLKGSGILTVQRVRLDRYKAYFDPRLLRWSVLMPSGPGAEKALGQFFMTSASVIGP